MSSFEHLAGGFAVAFTWKNLFYCLVGCAWGTMVGCCRASDRWQA